MMTKTKMKLILWSGFAATLLFSSGAKGYEAITVSNGGTIRGVVKIEGKIPMQPPLEITKAKEFCKNVPNESLIVGPNRGVRYGVVTIEGIARGKPVEREEIHELDNIGCKFVPHVLAASVGQFVLIKNTDPILHTAYAHFQGGQPDFNIGLYPGRADRKPLVSAGIVSIHCEVHPWMTAFIVVTDHPYHAVTDLYGEYEIEDVPPGTYALKLWHESLGMQEKGVDIKRGMTSRIDFILAGFRGVKK